jgi:metal-responsive CopG/Arc/MetJ family transcriptional regulator
MAAKIKMDKELYKRGEKAAAQWGYSSMDEFVTHLVEKALKDFEAQQGEDKDAVEERLRGLGYIE